MNFLKLAITALGNNPTNFIKQILDTVSSCDCSLLSLNSSDLDEITACYLLVIGNWNQIAKLESSLDNLQTLLSINIHLLRPEKSSKKPESIPYFLEIIAPSPGNIIENMSSFLQDREIIIEEINAKCYQPSCAQTLAHIFSVKLILSIPTNLNIRALREDLHDFSDQLNIDILFNPIT